mmetsp:Transcript_17695/g.52547  ORF Transcript_17695/g.52547 Transcript_17695/m.52547 type:complete len:251 (-) Transcript_17695:25-777(-)
MATLREAAWRGDVEMLRKCLRAGIRPDVTDDYGRTPLHLLCGPLHPQASSNTTAADEDRRAACFKLLRDAGANLEASDTGPTGNGWRPLHCAASSKSVELVSLLVQARVNVDAAGNSGVTALHLAGRRGAADCVEVLLAAGASLNLREIHNGNTPFDVALYYGTGGGHAPPEQRARSRRTWPLFLRAGAAVPAIYTGSEDQYLFRVVAAGGFQRYAQAHVARIASILETPLLPPELVRKVLEYWLHAGYY